MTTADFPKIMCAQCGRDILEPHESVIEIMTPAPIEGSDNEYRVRFYCNVCRPPPSGIKWPAT
jgi:hypothetical protein